MEDVLMYSAAAPLIVAGVALIRRIVPELRGRMVPLVVLGLTVAWGGLLLYTGRFSGDAAEFVVASVVVASAAIGLSSAVSTYTPDDSTANRLT